MSFGRKKTMMSDCSVHIHHGTPFQSLSPIPFHLPPRIDWMQKRTKRRHEAQHITSTSTSDIDIDIEIENADNREREREINGDREEKEPMRLTDTKKEKNGMAWRHVGKTHLLRKRNQILTSPPRIPKPLPIIII
jgi:hypothetical protein